MNVLVSCDLALEAAEWLKTRPGISVHQGQPPSAEQLQNAEAWIIRSSTTVNAKLLTQMPCLRMVVTATSGFDHLDLAELQARSIKAMYTPEGNAPAAAELTVALMLECVRKVRFLDRNAREGRWRQDLSWGAELNGRTLGVVGLGRIGRRVAAAAQALGMNVIGSDPFLLAEDWASLRIEPQGFEELLKQVDILTLHVPATTQTWHMMNSRTLELMPAGSILINVCRGSVMSEPDLVLALSEGHIAAAGLDVFENEPLRADSPWLRFPQVTLSPHAGAYTREAYERVSWEAVRKVVEWGKSQATSDELPPKAEWYYSTF